jgi:hypothetical protein
MTNLQELIETALLLSKNLEKAASEEKRFCTDICMTLERMSWETLSLSNDLESIKGYI